MTKNENAAKTIFTKCAEFEHKIEITFDRDEITLYWQNVRIDCEPDKFEEALDALRRLESLGAYFG